MQGQQDSPQSLAMNHPKELWIHFSESSADPDQRGVELEVLARLEGMIDGLRCDDM